MTLLEAVDAYVDWRRAHGAMSPTGELQGAGPDARRPCSSTTPALASPKRPP